MKQLATDSRRSDPVPPALLASRATSAVEKAAHAALGYLQLAAFVVTLDGMVLVQNPLAENLIERGEFAISGGELRCRRSEDSVRLGHALARAARGESMAWTFGLPGTTRLSGWLTRVEGSDTCLLLVTELGHGPAPDARLLSDLYGLTPREASVAAGLCAGRTLQELARELNIGVETARSHLKRIFDKTDTNRQTELVARLLTGIAGLRVR